MQGLFRWLNSAYKEELHLSHCVSELKTRDWNLSATTNTREGAGVSILALKIVSEKVVCLNKCMKVALNEEVKAKPTSTHVPLLRARGAGAKHREPLDSLSQSKWILPLAQGRRLKFPALLLWYLISQLQHSSPVTFKAFPKYARPLWTCINPIIIVDWHENVHYH